MSFTRVGPLLLALPLLSPDEVKEEGSREGPFLAEANSALSCSMRFAR